MNSEKTIMNIEQALKETGFVRCSFKSDGDDKCDLCSKPIKKGADVFYNRTCYEVDEGEYYCEPCTIKTPERWKQDEAMDTSYVLSQEKEQYRILQKGEVIQLGDEVFYDDPGDTEDDWYPVTELSVGHKAPDPQFISHRVYRRKQ